MGFRFRKSFKFGPFRITFSKSGISTSVGVKGARITKRADGKTQTTVSIPGTGIYSTKTINGKENTSASEKTTNSITAYKFERKESPYEFVKFYLKETRLKNPDGTKRQDVLYWYKMRKPPFDKQINAAALSDPETPTLVEITLNGHVIGKAPANNAQYICENWDRMDRVSAIDVEGRRGEYEACVHVRLKK